MERVYDVACNNRCDSSVHLGDYKVNRLSTDLGSGNNGVSLLLQFQTKA